jgi:dihydropteroate synthase
MIWQTRTRTFDLSRRGVVMGVLNVTPDSFSDGGQWLDAAAAVAHGVEMVAQGAEIVDVGGESTRPGAEPVDEAEEMRRVLPVIERLAALPGHGEQFVLSVDTMKPAVARAAMAAGASLINDVTGLREEGMISAVKDTGAGVVVMHMQGEPRTMQNEPRYENVVAEVGNFLCEKLERCIRCGVPATNVALDPGIGFGKTVEHNLELLRHLPGLRAAASGLEKAGGRGDSGVVKDSNVPGERPLLIGVSRKSFLGKILGSTAVADRAWPTVALTGFCRTHGARIFRVHDVKPNVEALRMTEAILA